nr:MAG TPA: Galactokinase galactose-binding signature [Caudoviricetes sp.]
MHAISVALFLWGFGVRHSGLVLFAPGRLCVLGYTCCSCY